MRCRDCGEELINVSVFEDNTEIHTYNLYQCDECGTIAKEDVGEYGEITWIDNNGDVTITHKDYVHPAEVECDFRDPTTEWSITLKYLRCQGNAVEHFLINKLNIYACKHSIMKDEQGSVTFTYTSIDDPTQEIMQRWEEFWNDWRNKQ